MPNLCPLGTLESIEQVEALPVFMTQHNRILVVNFA